MSCVCESEGRSVSGLSRPGRAAAASPKGGCLTLVLRDPGDPPTITALSPREQYWKPNSAVDTTAWHDRTVASVISVPDVHTVAESHADLVVARGNRSNV